MHASPVIFGEVLFDVFPDGSRVLGGAPFNVAWNLQGFGADPLFVSRVGADPEGERIRRSARQWGLNDAGLQTDADHGTGEVRITITDGEPTYDIVDRRAFDFIAADALPADPPGLIYHGTLALRQPESATALATLRAAQPDRVFMDINLRPPWWQRRSCLDAIEHATWVKLNGDELDELLPGDDTVEQRAERLLHRHRLELLVVTLGHRGALAIDARGRRHHVRPDRSGDVVDTVGAGDAFASVLILGIMRGWEIDTMLARAQRFASLVVGNRGAIIDDPAPFRMLADEWVLNEG